MTIKLRCACGQILRAPDEFSGKTGRCPHCASVVQVPDATQQASRFVPYSGSWEDHFKDIWQEFSDFAFGSEKEDRVQPPYSSEELYERVVGSILVIQGPGLFGTGVVIDRDGIVVTNRHVVLREHALTVFTSDGEEYPAETLRICRDLDLAFVKVALPRTKFAEFAVGRPPKVGQPVFAIGHPNNLQNTFTRGIVSGIDPLVDGDGFPYIRSDAVISHGNSGGPLFDEFGQIVGINSFVLEETPGLGYAIPADLCYERYQKLKKRLQPGSGLHYCRFCCESSVAPNYCDRCGASLRPEITSDKALPSAEQAGQEAAGNEANENRQDELSGAAMKGSVDLVETFLQKMGVDPAEQRVVDEESVGWAWDFGGSKLFVRLQNHKDSPFLSLEFPILFLPEQGALALYRRLLEFNHELRSCAFAVLGDEISVVAGRPVAGLDSEELEAMVTDLVKAVACLMDKLSEEFRAPKFSEEFP